MGPFIFQKGLMLGPSPWRNGHGKRGGGLGKGHLYQGVEEGAYQSRFAAEHDLGTDHSLGQGKGENPLLHGGRSA